MEIKKTTKLGQIVDGYKNAAEVLMGFGMHCFSCPISQMETLEEAAEVHGIDLDFMLAKLKEVLIPKKEQKKAKK